MDVAQREKQMAEAEALLADGALRASFAKGLFFGQYRDELLPPYPDVTADVEVNHAVEAVRRFCHASIDPVRIDREARIPDEVIRSLGQLGVLGACLPKHVGGRGFRQLAYCRMIEVIGGHCGGTALFVNAHHSIGPRAIVLFGTRTQQDRYLPKLATGEWLSAFALTEREAGSDAANVQTTATPTLDGTGYRLNGEKRWITNGGIAHVLTVMARTPVARSSDTKITAFIVTPDMPGFEVLEARMDKCGVRGSATGRLAFRDMFVPKENILGRLGQGLKVALTVLDFGRTTFGASCSGAAKFCVERAFRHAQERVQFAQPLASFELVKEKLAYMAAGAFAMESATYQTAALIDADNSDFMVETAMLKVFATEVLWRIINDTIQIYGGKAYFTDEPFERMMRDARINMIGEGANDVMRVFVALVGMREVGLELKGVVDALASPFSNLGTLGTFAGRRLNSLFSAPAVRIRNLELDEDATRQGALVKTLATQVDRLLRRYQESIFDRQYQLGRVADAAIELYVSACVLARIDRMLSDHHLPAEERRRGLSTGRYYLATAARRVRRHLADLWDNCDSETTAAADQFSLEPR